MNLSRSQNTGIAGATSSVWSFFSSNLFYALLTLVFVVLIYLYWHYIGYQVSASYTTLVDMISQKKEGSVGFDLTGSGSPSVGATASLPNADGSSDSVKATPSLPPVQENEDGSELPFRLFRDKTGNFKVEARLVNVDGDTVALEKRDGSVVNVPVAKLGKPEQEYVQLKRSN